MELLPAIKHRKIQSPAAVKSVDDSRNSESKSGGEDMGSTSTGSVEPNTHCPDLSIENKRLKKDNKKLTGELAKHYPINWIMNKADLENCPNFLAH